MSKVIRNRSEVSMDLPDELISELLKIGKQRNVSVRQQIREAITHLARANKKSSSSSSIADSLQPNAEADQLLENLDLRFKY
jgi:hypothetical protein